MPFIAPFVPAIIGGVTGLIGGRAAKNSTGQSNPYGQLGQKDLATSSNFFNNILSNPAEATATTTSDLGRQFQQGINFNSRNVTRGGASAGKIAEAPFQLASAAKGQQILARMNAANSLGELGLGAGKLDIGQQGLDIERTQANRNFWSGIGESIGGFLTKPGGLGNDSILGRIFKKPSPGGTSFGVPMTGPNPATSGSLMSGADQNNSFIFH